MAEMNALIQGARDRGLDITADQYPYVASMTGLQMCLPTKYLEGSHGSGKAKRLQVSR
jgi:hypothetical protein